MTLMIFLVTLGLSNCLKLTTAWVSKHLKTKKILLKVHCITSTNISSLFDFFKDGDHQCRMNIFYLAKLAELTKLSSADVGASTVEIYLVTLATSNRLSEAYIKASLVQDWASGGRRLNVWAAFATPKLFCSLFFLHPPPRSTVFAPDEF